MHDASHPTGGAPMPEARPVASHISLPDVRPWEDHAAIVADLVPQSSELDPVETSTGRVRNPLVPPCPEERTEVAITFRHSFWHARRSHIRDALCEGGTSTETLERFDACGTNCWVMQSQDGANRLRLAADRCHNRWCEACQAERRRLICRNLCAGLDRLNLSKDALRFVTLTLAHNAKPLREQLDRIYSCWQRLKQRPFFKTRIKGTIAFFEVTISQKDGRWHPHLHVMIHGDYIPKDKLSATWREVTGDSFIVDIRLIRNPREADCGWSPLAPLYQIVARARAGDADAVHILRQLSASNVADPIDAFSSTGPPGVVPDLYGPAPF